MAESNIQQLQAQHGSLEQQIEDEGRRLIPDQCHISELKRKKLRIKDALNRLRDLER